MAIRRCIGLLLILSTVGCVSVQDYEYKCAQHYRAHVAWWSCEQRCSSNPFSDYSCGWRTAYSDVLMGGDGRCPPVPPQCYWSAKYQSQSGDTAIQNWFQGYRDGSAVALASCYDHYNPVPMSPETRACLPGCLPTDRAPYPYGKTVLNPPLKDGSRPAIEVPSPENPSDYPITPDIPVTPDAPVPAGDLGNFDEQLPSPVTEIDETRDPRESVIPPAPLSSPPLTSLSDSEIEAIEENLLRSMLDDIDSGIKQVSSDESASQVIHPEDLADEE